MTDLEVGVMACGDTVRKLEDMLQWTFVEEKAAGDSEKHQEAIRKLEEMDRLLYSKDCPPPLQEAASKVEEMDRLLHSKDRPPPAIVAETTAGDREKLQDMVRKLEEMDQFLHSRDCPPPTIAELRLYGLIMRHVRRYILLFQMERSLQFMSASEAEETCASSMDEDLVVLGDNYFADIKNVNEEISTILYSFFNFAELLEDCRRSFAEIYSPLGKTADQLRIAQLVKEKEEASQGTHNGLHAKKSKGYSRRINEIISMKYAEAEGKKTTRELYLFNILHGLEEMRKLHSYAPPTIEDIHYYRDIRKLTTSATLYVAAKVLWQNRIFPEIAEGERAWVSVPQYLFGFLISDCPMGYQAASFFDELLELDSLLKKSCYSFAKILSSPSEGNGMKDLARYTNKRVDSVKVGRSEEKEAQGSYRCDVKKQILHFHNLDGEMMLETNGKLAVERIGELNKTKTRERYLGDIARLVAKMESLCLKTKLTISESRLLWQINKHVNCYIWAYNSEVEAIRFSSEGGEKFDLDKCSPVDSIYYYLSDANGEDEELKTREQYLQEIVSVIEEIQSSFLDTAPTAREAIHYSEIGRRVSLLALQWREEQGDKENEVKLDIAMLKHLLKAILGWELEWSKDVVKKCGKVLSETIIPAGEIDSGDALKWIHDNRFHLRPRIIDKFEDFVSGSPQRLEMLDQSLVVLRKVTMISNSIAEKLYKVNEIMGFWMKKSPCVVHLDVCSIDWSMVLRRGESGC